MKSELHVAAMPFPTRQGTQAIVHAMLCARGGSGRNAHLSTYGDGESGGELPYPLHRAARLVRGGGAAFRSGPSLRKLAQDVALTRSIAKTRTAIAPDVVIAHHVEAACAAMFSSMARPSRVPLVFFAHTGLGPELPTYGPPFLAPPLGRAGDALDILLCRRADAVAAISPRLARDLERSSGRTVTYVPPPWTVPASMTRAERSRGRAALGLCPDDEVILYTGNLDAYQGWRDVVAAIVELRRTHDHALLVVATASDPASLLNEAASAGVARAVRVRDLPTDEEGRRALYAAADVAVIPRRAAGGLPIKLLEALARGVPAVAVRRAVAGLPIGRAALVVADDAPDALANALDVALSTPRSSRTLSSRGQAYVQNEHSAERFTNTLDRVIEVAVDQSVSRNDTRSSISSLLRWATSPWRSVRQS